MFNGFSREAVDFLWNIRFNNNREWFLPRRQEYVELLHETLTALAEETQMGLAALNKDLGLERRVTRIYRDARLTHADGPYKHKLWFTLRSEAKEWTDTPVFYFEIGPENYDWGMGFYSAKARTMEVYRKSVDDNPARLTKLVEDFNTQGRFSLAGPDYARKKGDPGALLEPWYNKKSISLSCLRPSGGLLLKKGLAAEMVDGFGYLMPFYNYFMDVRSKLHAPDMTH